MAFIFSLKRNALIGQATSAVVIAIAIVIVIVIVVLKIDS